MAGKLTRFLAEDGATLSAGDPYAEVEVMKMFLSLKAPEDGVLRHACTEGCVLSDGDLVARLELTDPSKVKTSTLFEGRIPAAWIMKPHGRGTRRGAPVKPHGILRELIRGTLDDVVAGFEVPHARVDAALRALPDVLNDPQLPFSEFQEALSFFTGRLPPALETRLTNLLHQVEAACQNTQAASTAPRIAVEDVHFPEGQSCPESRNPFAVTFPESDEMPQSWRLVARIPALIREGKAEHFANSTKGSGNDSESADHSRAAAALDAAVAPLLQLASRFVCGLWFVFCALRVCKVVEESVSPRCITSPNPFLQHSPFDAVPFAQLCPRSPPSLLH